mmetsp:Transcript_77135/g.213189  ORF Transcript_77135/g.213189 Transcript_77135/m.213189 type:complete len:239 (+) Transcript_77135:612-1328(+)
MHASGAGNPRSYRTRGPRRNSNTRSWWHPQYLQRRALVASHLTSRSSPNPSGGSCVWQLVRPAWSCPAWSCPAWSCPAWRRPAWGRPAWSRPAWSRRPTSWRRVRSQATTRAVAFRRRPRTPLSARPWAALATLRSAACLASMPGVSLGARMVGIAPVATSAVGSARSAAWGCRVSQASRARRQRMRPRSRRPWAPSAIPPRATGHASMRGAREDAVMAGSARVATCAVGLVTPRALR